MKTKPRKYQREGVRMIHEFGGRALLADEMGLGKSLQALLYAKKYVPEGIIIIVCPAVVKYNWDAEARKHFGMRCEIIEGMKPPTKSILVTTCRVLIINYDILGPWLKHLRRLKPALVVLDECQNIQNPAAQRTKNTFKLCRRVKKVIALSGTPFTNYPAQMWAVLHLLRKKKYPSFYPFAMRFCAPKRRPWGWDFTGASKLKELHRRLKKDLMIRRLKKDVLKELPAKSRIVVPLDIRNRNEYDAAVKDFLGWLARKSPHKARKASHAEAVVRIGYLKRLVARLKFRNVIKWIENFLEQSNEKLIVFAIHKPAIKLLQKKFKKMCVVVNGSVKGSKRQQAVDKFQKDKNTRVFIGNLKAAGVGLTLTAASTVVFAELGWTPGEHTQAEDRPHRIGQLKNVRCYYLIGRDTLEEKLCALIQEKQSKTGQVLDGKSKRRAAKDLDIHNQLIASLAG